MKKIFILSALMSLVIFSSCKKELEVEGPPVGSGPVTITLTAPTPGEAISSNQAYTFSGTINAPSGLRSAYLKVMNQSYPIAGSGAVVSFSVPVNIPENFATGAYEYTLHADDFDGNVKDLIGTFTLTQGLNATLVSPAHGFSSAFIAGLSGEFMLRLNYTEAPAAISIHVDYGGGNVQVENIDLADPLQFFVDVNDTKGSHLAKKSVVIPSEIVAGTYDFSFEVVTPSETIIIPGKLEVSSITTLWVLGDATTALWDIDNPIEMTSLGSNQFSKSIHLLGSPASFKFVLEKGSWDVSWGTNETSPVTIGTEYQLVSNGGNIMVAAEGDYVLVVNFETNTFKVEEFATPSSLFLLGGSTPAGWDNALALPMDSVAPGKFQVFSPLTAGGGGFKFIPTLGSWTGDWGQKPGEPGKLLQEGEENCPVTEDGFYRITVDFNTMTFVAEKTVWGVIGDATINGWTTDTNMVYVGGAEPYTWELVGYTYSGPNKKIKFRANDSWTINMGDDLTDGSLEQDGDDIPITAGVHTVRMTLAPTGYTYQILP